MNDGMRAGRDKMEKKSQADKDDWGKLVKLVDEMPSGKVPRGLNELLDFISQVWNGGLGQYVANDYKDGFYNSIRFLKAMGDKAPKAQELAKRMLDLEPNPADLDRDDVDEEDYQRDKSWEKFEDWFYKGVGEAVAKEVLKSGKIAASVAVAAPISIYLNQLIKKDWELPVEKEFAEEVEEQMATKKLSEKDLKKHVMDLYEKYLPKLSSATDDFWDLLSAILHGVKASTELRALASFASELVKAGIAVPNGKIAKADLDEVLSRLADELVKELVHKGYKIEIYHSKNFGYYYKILGKGVDYEHDTVYNEEKQAEYLAKDLIDKYPQKLAKNPEAKK